MDLLWANRLGRTTDVAKLVTLQLLDAIQHVHGRGIVHNDINSENILLQPGRGGMRIWFVDFGCASQIEDPKTEMLVGTEHFRAAELCGQPGVKRRWNAKVDVFAVGLLTYRMVTRLKAFDLRHPFEKGEFRPHPKIDADQTLKNILTGLLQIKPQKRPSTSSALAHDAFCTAKKYFAMEVQKLTWETRSGDECEAITASRAKFEDSRLPPRSAQVSFLN
jgi:p70 ribosomal S6 kinase